MVEIALGRLSLFLPPLVLIPSTIANFPARALVPSVPAHAPASLFPRLLSNRSSRALVPMKLGSYGGLVLLHVVVLGPGNGERR